VFAGCRQGDRPQQHVYARDSTSIKKSVAKEIDCIYSKEQSISDQ
jgi:hypothetical protein